MTAAAIKIVLGLIGLAVGGDVLVRGAVGLAERLRVSALMTGLVLVGFGTSTPELVTSINAILKDSPAIALGNVIGSNIANILLILGLAALIVPLSASREALKRDGPMMAVAAIACLLVTQFSAFGRLTGVLFVAILVAYLVYTYFLERRVYDQQAALHAAETALARPASKSLWLSLSFAVGGIGIVIVGASLTVDGSLTIARALGVSELVIGLTIVAVGTSLPELATSVVAAVKKQTDIAVGNVIGSNIFNMLGILGVSALVRPFDVPGETVRYDAWIMIAATALLLAIVWARSHLNRISGAVFLLFYAVYMVFLAMR